MRLTQDDVLSLAEIRRKAASGEAREVRLEADVTLQEIGEHCGRSGDAVRLWELGRGMPRGRAGLRYARLIEALARTVVGVIIGLILSLIVALLAIPRPEDEPTLSVERAGEFCGLGRSSAYQAVARGDLPVIRFGRSLRVPTAKLRVLLGLDVEPAADAEVPADVVPLRGIR